VGAVGAKLLYPDGTIQHAGVVVGIGDAAGHAHRHLDATNPGYFLMPHVAQSITAVTAACMVVEKAKFEKVGGLSEEFAVAFNDVDFCLKLQAAGWTNIYVPHAVLVHHESKSRGKDDSPGNIDRFRRELQLLQERWQTNTYKDPLHNPNLDRSSETFVVRL
jgi:GT2 family glycosyltransferase